MEKLSIVLPCYNPQEGWEQRILEAYNSITEKLSFAPAIILVNDGSSQQLPGDLIELLKSAIPQFLYTAYTVNKGKGYALRHGVRQAQTDFVIYTDIDFPYTTDSLIKVWESLQSGGDIVVGIKDEAYYRGVPATRMIISRILRRLIRLFFSMPVTDTQCGLKGFNRKGREFFLNTTINRYLCDLEFIYKSFRHIPKVLVVSQPVRLREGVIFSRMNMTILLRESLEFLKLIFKK